MRIIDLKRGCRRVVVVSVSSDEGVIEHHLNTKKLQSLHFEWGACKINFDHTGESVLWAEGMG